MRKSLSFWYSETVSVSGRVVPALSLSTQVFVPATSTVSPPGWGFSGDAFGARVAGVVVVVPGLRALHLGYVVQLRVERVRDGGAVDDGGVVLDGLLLHGVHVDGAVRGGFGQTGELVRPAVVGGCGGGVEQHVVLIQVHGDRRRACAEVSWYVARSEPSSSGMFVNVYVQSGADAVVLKM